MTKICPLNFGSDKMKTINFIIIIIIVSDNVFNLSLEISGVFKDTSIYYIIIFKLLLNHEFYFIIQDVIIKCMFY